MSLLVFHDHGSHWAAPLLKPGFRHVFACVNDGHCWIRVDAQAGLPCIEAVAAATDDLAGFYRDCGYTVVRVEGGKPHRWPLAIANCVGLAKAVCGIRSRAWTPYQLYRDCA